MTLKFFDVSHYQGDYHPTGPTIAKATEGTTFVDSQYDTNKSRTLAGGWPFVGYHFLTTQDATAQAKHAFAHIGKTPAMLDVETGTTGNPSLATVVDFVKAFRALGGNLNLIYLPKWYWSGHWGSPSLQPLKDLGLALISSAYTSYSDTGIGWNSYGGMAPAIWQYTSTPIDTNAFKGTVDELRALFETGHIDMALTATDAKTNWQTDGIIDNRPWRADVKTNPTIRPDSAVEIAMDEAHAARVAAEDALAAVKALTGGVDVAALAAALAPLLAPVVHAELTKLGVTVNVAS